MKKIIAFGRDSLQETEAHVVIRFKNRTQWSRNVLTPKGDPRNPLSFDEISEKFKGLTRKVLPDDRINQIIPIVKHLEKMKNPSTLLKLCRVKEIDRT
jgi:2-methylcitrate dehydratase